MKKIILLTFVLVIIPFLMVTFIHIDRNKDITIKEISLNYKSSVIVRVHRDRDNTISNVTLEEYVVSVVASVFLVVVSGKSPAFKPPTDTKDDL